MDMKVKQQKSFAELSALLADCKTQLAEALDNTDVDRTSELRTLIKSLNEELPIAEMRELKARLQAVELELQTNEDTKKLLRVAIAESKDELQKRIDALRPYQEELDRRALQLTFAENDAIQL